jgi:hypothetical protein
MSHSKTSPRRPRRLVILCSHPNGSVFIFIQSVFFYLIQSVFFYLIQSALPCLSRVPSQSAFLPYPECLPLPIQSPFPCLSRVPSPAYPESLLLPIQSAFSQCLPTLSRVYAVPASRSMPDYIVHPFSLKPFIPPCKSPSAPPNLNVLVPTHPECVPTYSECVPTYSECVPTYPECVPISAECVPIPPECVLCRSISIALSPLLSLTFIPPSNHPRRLPIITCSYLPIQSACLLPLLMLDRVETSRKNT